ncbi:hypothetical protein ACWEQ4_07060 [Rhodococcus sp. NPDC003994]
MEDGSPRIVRSDDVSALPRMGTAERTRLWQQVGLVPTLERLSRMFADLDLSQVTGTDDDVTRAFLADVSEPARTQAATMLAHGHVILHPIPLFLAIKEVIIDANADGDTEPSSDDLLAALLSLSTEAHQASIPAPDISFDDSLEQMTMNRVTQAAFLFPQPLEFLSGAAERVWYGDWSARTAAKSRRSLAVSPAKQWTEITGLELDDFLSLGWIFYNLWRHEGFSYISRELLAQYHVPPNALDFLFEHCTVRVEELRSHLTSERDVGASLWTRYRLQQTPLVLLDDGKLLPIRFQFVLQRIFGDHLFLESQHILRMKDAKRADHYADAMRDLFEERVGEVLRRICDFDSSDKTVLVEEDEMKRNWRTSKSKLPKICDFAMFRGHTCILVDANMRLLPQALAEGEASMESLHQEIEGRFKETKYRQLLSTVDLFMNKGWNRIRATMTGRTQFIPIVVVPDAGIPSDIATENAIFITGLSLVQKYNVNPNYYTVHAPAILTWRDLLKLEGLAERGVDIFLELKRWRNIHPLGLDGREPLPVTLGEFLDRRHRVVPMSQAEHHRGWDFFERLRAHVAGQAVAAVPEQLRSRFAAQLAQQQDLLPTFENRHEFVEQDGRAVRPAD